MFQYLYQCGKKVLWAVIVPSAFVGILVPLKEASSLACVLALAVAFSIMCFPVKASDENQKIVAVAAFIIAALVFYTLAAILSEVSLTTIGILVVLTWLVTYIMSRFLHHIDPKCPFTWFFITLLPLGFVIVKAAKIFSKSVSPREG